MLITDGGFLIFVSQNANERAQDRRWLIWGKARRGLSGSGTPPTNGLALGRGNAAARALGPGCPVQLEPATHVLRLADLCGRCHQGCVEPEETSVRGLHRGRRHQECVEQEETSMSGLHRSRRHQECVEKEETSTSGLHRGRRHQECVEQEETSGLSYV